MNPPSHCKAAPSSGGAPAAGLYYLGRDSSYDDKGDPDIATRTGIRPDEPCRARIRVIRRGRDLCSGQEGVP